MSFIIGFGVGLSLIVAIGAQNIWVLSQSMAGANRLIIAGVCITCDCLLIILGVAGISRVQQYVPEAVPILTVAGVLLLVWLSWQALARVFAGGEGLKVNSGASVQSPMQTALTALAISLLNPHVYLDTVFLIGGLANQHAYPVLFAAGACVASFCWFSCLTAMAPSLKVYLNSPKRWQVFDGAIAILLGGIAINLALGIAW